MSGPTPPLENHEPPLLLPTAARVCAWVQGGAATVGLVIGATNLVVWLGLAREIAAWPGVMVMRFNTSLGIIAAALSLALWPGEAQRGWRSRLAMMVGGAVLLIGGLTALEDLAGLDLGIDQLFVPGTFPGDRANAFVAHPGRMSLNAALSMFFLGLALVGLDWRVKLGRSRLIFPAPGFALLAALPAACGLVGHMLDAQRFTGLLRSTNILLHVAVALFLLAHGLLAARPLRPPVARVFSRGPDGLLLRWLLPGSTGLLLLLAWTINEGRKRGLIAPGEGTALMLYGGLVLLPSLILVASRAVARQEAEARRAEAARREGEERFRALADTISQFAWMTDETGRVVWMNRRWFEFTGTTMEEMAGWGWQKVHHPDHVERVVAKLAACFQSGEPWEDLFPLRGANGEYRWFLSRAMPICEESGKVQRWFGTNTDVTEQRALVEQLAEARDEAERASHAKDNFLAALSHELRTPLTPVLLSAAALRLDERLPAEVRSELTMIERNVALEGRLIDDLLDLTRITRGKLRLRTEHCDVHSLLGHAVEIVRDEAQAGGVEIELALAARRCGLQGDPARLQQVFWNVLRNAVKFTPAGGRISIRTSDSATDSRLVLAIADTGAGFAPELADSLFQPFEQGNRAEEHRFGGLGLGLAIARAIVDLHGGVIRAESAGPGCGATFTVELPGATEAPSGMGAPGPEPDGETDAVRPLRILLVEDHEPTLAVLHRLLRRAGDEVLTAGSVASALAVAEGAHFDVIISDLGLPDGSGHELMKQLLAIDPRLRGIALSGYGMEEDLRRSEEAGFFTHLIKPVKIEDLRQALRQVRAQAAAAAGAESDRAGKPSAV